MRALAADTLGELLVVTTSLGGVDDLLAELAEASERSRTTPSHVAVSEALKRRIALGGFSGEGRLPTERELAAVLGVGRNTIRRAVRELAEQGVVETTLGRNGGTRVRAGAADSADRERITADFGRALDRHLEFRSVIEPPAAALAARRATPSQRAAIRRALEAPADGLAGYHRADNLLHFAIGKASGNPVLADAIASARAQMFADTNVLWLYLDWHEVYGSEQPLAEVLRRDHEPVVTAIERGDGVRAEAEMRAHLDASRAQFEGLLERLRTPDAPQAGDGS